MTFDLCKWYLDCVSEEGYVFIGYSARLACGPFHLNYESALDHRQYRGTQTSHSLRCSEPVVSGADVSWATAGLGVAGRWKRCGAELRETVFRSESGSVEWSCVSPRSRATLQTDGAQALDGLGYAEYIRMTVPPWQIPIRTLRWGRFLSESDAIVWIDWQGVYRNTIVYRNGLRAGVEHVGDDRMELADGTRLELDRGLVLVQGDLGSTVLSAIPGIGGIAPARMLATDQCKWRSYTALRIPGRPAEYGWSIHEVVEWP